MVHPNKEKYLEDSIFLISLTYLFTKVPDFKKIAKKGIRKSRESKN